MLCYLFPMFRNSLLSHDLLAVPLPSTGSFIHPPPLRSWHVLDGRGVAIDGCDHRDFPGHFGEVRSCTHAYRLSPNCALASSIAFRSASLSLSSPSVTTTFFNIPVNLNGIFVA